MKKPLFAVLLIALLSITLLAGCAGSTTPPTEAPTDPPATEAPTEAPAPTELKRITAEEAEAIALKHAGVSAENVSRIRTEFDYDDGRAEYDIEFYAEGWEYDYEIHAQTGEILRSEAEPPEVMPTEPPATLPTEPPATEAAAPVSAPTEKPKADRISETEARDIALKHAGLTADQVSRLRVTFDYDDGRPEYEVDFVYDGFEYDYEIHAETGKILSWDKDRDD